jgi:uncharacterized delta-60 repeat protein
MKHLILLVLSPIYLLIQIADFGVALQPDGKILVVGQTDRDEDFDTNGIIVRFNSNGTLDTTFNSGQGYINQEGNTNSLIYESVSLQPDGKILVVGINDTADGLIARYLSNGVLDAESNWNVKNFRESAQINGQLVGLLSK